MTDYERGVEQASNIYREVIREYVAENAKLREERDHWRVEQVHAYGNWEDTYKRASELEAENTKLRELVRKYGEYTSQDRCEGCFCKSRCNDGDFDECWQLTEIRRLVRELGVDS